MSVVEDGAVDASATFVFDDPSFDSKACRVIDNGGAHVHGAVDDNVNVNVDDLG